MKWPLQREDHNRQEKTRKPNYREYFAEESQFKASPAYLEGLKHYFRSQKAILDVREVFKRQIMRQYFDAVFDNANRHFRFRWNFKDYMANNEGNVISNRTWKEQKIVSAQDFDAIEEAINKSQPISFDLGDDAILWRLIPKVQVLSERITPQRTPADVIAAPILNKGVNVLNLMWRIAGAEPAI